MKNKPNILIISNNFAGGGLETRINSIVDKFCDNYNFRLLTKTLKQEMRIPASENFEYICNWDNFYDAIKDVQIIDMHPFWLSNLFDLYDIDTKIKTMYTLHGEISIEDSMNKFYDRIDRVYAVSELTINKFKQHYPTYMNKVRLAKNYFPLEISRINNNKQNSKNILISITSTLDWHYIEGLIKQIPLDYNIHIVGNIKSNFDIKNYPNTQYDGFVNIPEYLNSKDFCLAFSRGGFAAMDIIAENIPTILIYTRNNSFYLEGIVRSNFETLSNQNFVTTKIFDGDYFTNILNQIKSNSTEFLCTDLLKKYNAYELMKDIYKELL